MNYINHFLLLAKFNVEDDSLSNSLMTTNHYTTSKLLISNFLCLMKLYR